MYFVSTTKIYVNDNKKRSLAFTDNYGLALENTRFENLYDPQTTILIMRHLDCRRCTSIPLIVRAEVHFARHRLRS